MAKNESAKDPAKAAFLAALEKKKSSATKKAGESHAEGKGAAKGPNSGVTRRIERRRSGSS
jgi:hypothetical protein